MSIRSCLALGHPYHLYTYEAVAGVPEGTTIMDANEILPSSKVFFYEDELHRGSVGGFANLFRFKLLAMRGGIWLDLDMVLLKHMNFSQPYLYSSEVGPKRPSWVTALRAVRHAAQPQAYPPLRKWRINNTVMQVPPDSPIMRACYERAAAMGRKNLRWRMNGSALLTTCIRRFRQARYVVDPDVFMPIRFWDISVMVERGARVELPDLTHGVHLWNERWRIAGRRHPEAYQKDRVYPADTFYGALQRRFLGDAL